MSFAWAMKLLISTILLAPTNGLLLLVIAGLFRRRRWAFGLAVVATLLTFLQCLPAFADKLLDSLESQSAALAPDAPKPDAGAIVILGGGLDTDAPEYGGDTISDQTLVRTRYGATLARRYHLPVLVTGGQTPNTNATEASLMATVLRDEFGVETRWQESNSLDTAANAAHSAPMLKAAGITRVVLVTQAFHMPRAKLLFEQAGLEVIAAPTGFISHPGADWLLIDFLPHGKALRNTYRAQHEWLGLAWLLLTHPAEGAPQ